MPITPSALIPENPSPQPQPVLKWAKAVSTADMCLLGSIVVEDYVQLVLPASLNTPPVTSRDQILRTFGQMMPLFTSFVVTIHEITETPGKVVIHSSSDGETSFGYHYVNEYTFIFDVAEQTDGSHKITKVKEFSDSKATAALRQALSTKALTPSS